MTTPQRYQDAAFAVALMVAIGIMSLLARGCH